MFCLSKPVHIRDKASRVPVDVGNLESGKTDANLPFIVHPIGGSRGEETGPEPPPPWKS